MDTSQATAADIMSSPVHSIEQDMDVREAIAKFEDFGISGAPVVDGDGKLVGVVSQTDIVAYYLSRDDELQLETDYYQRAHLGAVPWGGGFEVVDTNVPRVKELMSPVTITVTESTSVNDVAHAMLERRIHRVIVTKGEEVSGVISALDLVKAFVS